MYYDKYKHISPEILGKVIYNETISEFSGSFEEIGYDILDVLCDCKTEAQFDLVNRTIMAITGSKLEVLEKIAAKIQEARIQIENSSVEERE